MSIHPKYTGLVFVDNNGQRGDNNFYAQYPYCSMWGRKHIYYVYYCGNPDCLRRLYRTWDKCPHCGQKINWEYTDNAKKGGKYYYDKHGIKKLRKKYRTTGDNMTPFDKENE